MIFQLKRKIIFTIGQLNTIKKKLKNVKYKSKNLGIGVLSSLVSIHQNENFKEKEYIIKSALISSALVFERTKNLLKKLNLI